MTKPTKFCLAAVLVVCVLAPATSAFGRSAVEKRVEAELRRQRAKADARVQRAAGELNQQAKRATAHADRTARQAGVRITARGGSGEATSKGASVRKGVQRREAMRRSIERRLPGGDRRPGRR